MNPQLKAQLRSALTSRPLQYALLIGGVLLVIYYVGRKAGKGVSVSYPGSKESDAVTTDFVNKQAPNILNNLFEAFDGLSMDVDTKTLAIAPLISMTDNQLVYIFNRYNQRYLAGKGETLYTVINGEYFGPIGLAAKYKAQLLKRMRELGMDNQ
ncbi:hypothetical protein GCM10027578_22240 [Spirosoma luteolum]